MKEKTKKEIRDYMKLQRNMACSEQARKNANDMVRLILTTPKEEAMKIYNFFID